MEYRTLGKTGLRVSVAGLGCGGFSQLGLAQGKSEADAIGIVRQAIELGVNLFDTAAAYGTEEVLGKAIKTVWREDVVICTKAPFSFSNPHSTPEGIVASLDKSLRRLDTDYIDVYQLHGVPPSAYEYALNDLAPVLLREKAKGKFRHLGITETAPHDPEHQVLHRAAQDKVWEVVMLGFHMMHQNARDRVFPLTRASGVGTLLMFAVRNIFSQAERLRATMRDLAAAGEVPQWLAETPDTLDRKSTRLNSSHRCMSYAVFCLKKQIKPFHKTSRYPETALKPSTTEPDTLHEPPPLYHQLAYGLVQPLTSTRLVGFCIVWHTLA